MQAPAWTIRSAVVALVLLALGLAPPALARPHLVAATCLYPAADPGSADLAAADATAAPTLAVSNAAVSSADVSASDVAPTTTALRSFGHRLVAPIGGACLPSSSWDVTPSFTDPYYPDNATADKAEKPFPLPPTTTLPTWQNNYDWDSGHGYAGWHSTSSATHGGTYGIQSNYLGHYGLWLWPAGGAYGPGDYAEWTYTAPGTTRISTAKLWFIYRNKLLAHHCLEVGLRTASGTVIDQNVHCKPTWRPDYQRGGGAFLVDPANSPTATVLYFRIRLDCGKAASCSKNVPARNPYWNGAFARLLEANIKLVDDDLPVVSPGDQFWDLRDDYSNGRTVYPLSVAATDAGSGIVRNWVERLGAANPPPLPAKSPCMLPAAPLDGSPPAVSGCCGALPDSLSCPPPVDGSGVLASSNAPCDPTHHTDALDARICPDSYAFSTSIDTNPFPEGTNQFVARSVDPAGNVGSSDLWNVSIDRTPPVAPGGITLQGFDSDLGLATVTWSDTSDPALPDGVPGSGVARYEVRWAVNGGAFGPWTDPDDDLSIDIDGLATGDTLAVEVHAIDRVGNVSAAGSATFTMPDTPTPHGPVVSGNVVDGSGNGVAASVSISVTPDDGTEVQPVGTATSASDGSFEVRLSQSAAAAVIHAAVANGGWVNFDVFASTDTLVYNGVIARRIGLTGWSDGYGNPAPLTIRLAADGPGVSSVPTVVRSLMARTHRTAGFPICIFSKTVVDEKDALAPVGELHTAGDMHAQFTYGQKADSSIEIGFSVDGKNWSANGTAHVGTSNEFAASLPLSANKGRVMLSEFHFKKYKYVTRCPFGYTKTHFEVRATDWNSGMVLGKDVSSFDHQCLTTYVDNKVPWGAGAHAFRRSAKAFTYGAGVTIFGATLGVTSGYSKYVEADWWFGRQQQIHYLCGDDNKPPTAKRIFAGS